VTGANDLHAVGALDALTGRRPGAAA
jgi:hypothetical protein